MNFFPLCTASVCPTNSGVMVERRDQVFRTFLSRLRFISSIRLSNLGSTYGPFFTDRPMGGSYFLRFTISFEDCKRLRRVFRSSFPQGLQGCRPPEDFPSPPPRGWSWGFMATPPTEGRIPR